MSRWSWLPTLGSKPDEVEVDSRSLRLKTELAPRVRLEVPVMFAAMSYGAVSINVHESLARVATEAGTLWNTGEGGLHPSYISTALTLLSR